MALNPRLKAADDKTEQSYFETLAKTLERSGPLTSFHTTLRTRSPLAIRALTQLAAPGSSLDDLIGLSHASDDTKVPGFRSEYAYALAGVLYANGLYQDSHALYRLATWHSDAPVPDEHQNWYARSALHATGSVDALLQRLPAVTETDRRGIEADAAHPVRGGGTAEWLKKFSTLTGMEDLTLSEGTLPLFDRLGAVTAAPVKSQVKISIIMTCYRPGVELRTAIRSVLAQSWQNWELLLVDDCSSEQFHPTIAEIRELDPRIKLLMLPRNSGTYAARNRALTECTGQIVTGLDSDDWAHPRWLERQVQPLLEDARAVMSVSSAIRVHPDLTVTKSSRAIRGPRSTSIMFRAEPVRGRMGYFDSVRKGADTEFRMRFNAVFGNRAIKRLTDVPLTLVRLGDETLTSSEFGMSWIHPARMAYQSAQRLWHHEIRVGRADPFMCADAPERPFFAPAFSHGRRLDGSVYDCVFVTDGRFTDETQQAFLNRMVEAAEDDRRTAFLHLESLYRPVPDNLPLHETVLSALHEHDIDFLAPTDEVETKRLLVADPSLWEGREAEYGLSVTGEIEVGHAVIEPTPWTEPSSETSPSADSRRPPAPAPSRRRFDMRALRRFAAVGLILACLFTVVSWVAFGMPVAAIATFTVATACLSAAALLSTAPGYRRLMTAIDRRLLR